MFVLDLFNNDHERRLAEGAVDQLEQRRIDDLAMKMDDLVARAKNPAYKKNPAALAALMKEFQKCKAERDSYYKIRNETMGYGGLTSEENVNEGSMKDMLWDLSDRMDRDQFIDYTTNEMGQDADEMAQFWDNIHGPLDETGIPGNVPVEKIPGKEDLLKGRGRGYYEDAESDSMNPNAKLEEDDWMTRNRRFQDQATQDRLDHEDEMQARAFDRGQRRRERMAGSSAAGVDLGRWLKPYQMLEKNNFEPIETKDRFEYLMQVALKLKGTGAGFDGWTGMSTAARLFKLDPREQKLVANLIRNSPRIKDLETYMRDTVEEAGDVRAKTDDALRAHWEKVKREKQAGTTTSVPVEKIPGKADLLKGKGRSYYESQKKKSDPVDEGQVSDEVTHRGNVDTKANIEVLGVDLANDTFKITYNDKPYTIKIQNFSQEDLGRWQIADYDVDIINSKGKKVRINWDKDRQVTMVNTIIAYLDTQQAGDIQYMAWRQVGLENSTAEDLYQEIQDFYQNDQQKIDKTTAWLAQNMEDTDQRQVFADYVKNPVSRPARTKYIPKEYLMYVAFSYSREGNTELTPGMNLKPIQLTDPDDEEEFYRKVDELFKKVQFKFDAFEKKIIELGDSYGLGSDPDLGSGFGQREIIWDHKTMTTSSSESNLNRQQILAQSILNFQAEVKKYVESFNNTLIKIGLPGIGEYSTWAGVLGDQLTDQQVRYFDTPEGFANLASGKVDLAKMLDDNVEKLGLKETGNPTLGEKKLGQLRPSLGTGHDIGRSIKKFRTQRGLDEYISMGSDKNYQEAEPYKNYRIYVRKKPFGTTGMYTAHTEIDRKEFMGKGASQEEAVQAIQDRIDFVLNAQRKVTGSSTIDFNVKFATDLLADPRQTFYAKLENINGEPKLVIASADVASDPELLAAGDFKRSALRNQPDEQGSATPLPGIPLTAKGLRSGDWIANGRYTVGNETQDRDGNRVFDLTYHSTAHTKSDKLRLNQPAFTLGTAREVDEHGGGIGPRQHWQDLMQENKLAVGDPVIVTAPNEFEGKTGEIYDFAPSGKFVIVNLYNHGKHSMHLSDVEFNQYADDQEQDDWYDEGVAEAIPTIRGTPKAQLGADYTGKDLVSDANALFTAGGFKLADKEVEPRVDNPKKINTTYYWRKKIKGLTPDQGQVQQLMIEIYNYAPNRTYWAINDWANDGARVTPDLAQKLWRRMEKTIKDSIDTAEQENYWYSMIGNGKKSKGLEEEGVAEGAGQQLSVQQLAQISDAALDSAYGYGRSQPGNTFGWQANLKSAAFAKQMIDKGITDVEAISDAIHKGWNVTAQAFVKNPDQFDDYKTMAPEKLQAKIAQRQKLMTQQYAQLPEEEKEKDRVVARAMLQAITGGQQGVAEGFTDTLKFAWRELKTNVVDFVANAIRLPNDQRQEVFVRAGNEFSNEVIKLLANHPARDKLIPMVREIGGYMAKARTLEELKSLLDKAGLFLADVDTGKFNPTSGVAKTLPGHRDKQGVEEGWSDAMVARRTGRARTPYSVYIKGKKWKDFENDDHAEAVANKLRAKFRAEGRDPGVITIAPTDIPEGVAETALNTRDPQGDYAAKRRALHDLSLNKDVDQAAVQQRRLDLDREAQAKGIAETVSDVRAGMARIYRKLAPKIERHRDSFLAGQLYDELENYAELHGAEREFKQMMNGARNRAHMEYDTNPGGFQNWFWFLPFAEELSEEQDTSGVERAILNRIMVAHTDLLMKFGPEKVMQAAEEVAYNVGDVDEIGTSDVSAYVHQVKQILGVPEELDEKWSQKYKNTINCSNPKGFSQKAHCAGKKK